MKKKILSLFLIFSFLACIFPDMPIKTMNTEAASQMTLQQLQAKFPAGKYWNHAGSSKNNPDGFTSTPCSHHGNCSKGGTDYSGSCGCNSFQGLGIQCHGFTLKLGYDAYGSNPTSWKKVTNTNSVKAGDIIRYKSQGHSIFVTAVNGDTITYGDCNSDGHCKIRWNQTISKSALTGFNYVLSAPSELSTANSNSDFPGEIDSSYSVPISVTADHKFNTYDSNGNMESNRWIDAGDNCTINQIYKNGYVNVTYPVSSGTRTAYAKLSDFSLAPANNMPDGVVDICSGGNGCVNISGWCYDPDDTNAQLDVHIYLGSEGDAGTCIGALKANGERKDVGEIVGCGDYHGYSGTLSTDIAPGRYFARAAFLDSAGGMARWVEGGWITVEYNPAKDSVNLGDNFDAEIQSADNGKFVIASSENGNVIQCGKDANEYVIAAKTIWNFNRNPDNTYNITSYYNNNCLDVWLAEDKDGTNVCTHTYTEGDIAEKWYIIPCGNGYKFLPACSKTRYLDVTGASNDNFANMQIHETFDARLQKFYINNVTGDSESPVIKDVKISDITSEGYKVTITATDNVGIKKIAVPTWTDKNGQDDLFDNWTNSALATQINKDTWEYYVKTSDHNNELGVYYTHVYAWDFKGNEGCSDLQNEKIVLDFEKPFIQDVIISDVTQKGYKVTIKATDNVGIQKVAVPTWVSWNKDGTQADLFDDWTNTTLATKINDDTWEYYVYISEHNGVYGVYKTDVYAWDFAGNYYCYNAEDTNKRFYVKVGVYDLTLDANGGKMPDGNNTFSPDSSAPKLTYHNPNYYDIGDFTPSREGYIFKGWYTEKTGGTKVYDADGKCTNEGTYWKDNFYQYWGNLKVYAQWEKNILKGDANNDGEATIADLVMLQKWILGSSNKLDLWQNVDLCEDGVIDSFDMVMLRRVLIEKAK